MSDIVVGNKGFTEIAKPNEIVSLLLDDDELKTLDQGSIDSAARNNGAGASSSMKWDDDGDDFFGGGQPNTINDDDEEIAGGQATPAKTKAKGKGRPSMRGKKKSLAGQRETGQ